MAERPTHNCRPRFNTNHIMKYADDTTTVGLIQDNNEVNYRKEVQHLVDWCRINNLHLNVDKTKEIIVDFRRSRPNHAPVLTNDKAMEIVSSTKFLGVHITDNLSWTTHITSLVKKAQQRLHFLRRIEKAFESLPTSSISSWSGSCKASDWKSLPK